MARPFVEKYTPEEINQVVQNMMQSIGVQYAPTWSEIRAHDHKKLNYFKSKYDSYKDFAESFGLLTQAEYIAKTKPVEPNQLIVYQLNKFMTKHKLEAMPTKSMFYEQGEKTLYNRIMYHYGGLQLAAAHLKIEYIHGGQAV